MPYEKMPTDGRVYIRGASGKFYHWSEIYKNELSESDNREILKQNNKKETKTGD